ncbi:hypothetical protein [Sphingomonas sp.]|uniref:hypothetical protein n=1 Tax=Sphingomonas sp. TaxID=28214 RepID=UPI002E30BB8F|nr:hypothetical protein [Sphingomonas sp.]HEX4695698.1 hypothetical protein [Sphingomonas sp.]
MADVSKETSEIERVRAEMHGASSLTHELMFAFDGMSGLLLAVLSELREIKAKLPDA